MESPVISQQVVLVIQQQVVRRMSTMTCVIDVGLWIYELIKPPRMLCLCTLKMHCVRLSPALPVGRQQAFRDKIKSMAELLSELTVCELRDMS